MAGYLRYQFRPRQARAGTRRANSGQGMDGGRVTLVNSQKKPRAQKKAVNGSGCLKDHVRQTMDKYFQDMDGHEPANLYDLVLSEIEAPLFESVLRYTQGNVSRAAEMLGMNRGTLRSRMRKYDLG